MVEILAQQLSSDRSLAYRDPLSLWSGASALRSSMQRQGMLVPVWARRVGEAYQLVAGFRRVETALELGLQRIPAVIVDGNVGELFCKSVERHAGQEANLRERARAVSVGLSLGWTARQVAQRLLPALALEPSGRLAEHLARVGRLPPELLDLLVAKSFSLRRSLAFCALDAAEARSLARVATQLALGARQIEEVGTWLQEIARREQLPLAQVLQQLGLGETDEPDRAASLQRLEQRRYPEATRRRAAIAALCDGFAAGLVTVRHHKNFAADGVDLSLHVDSVAQLREAAARLADGPTLERLDKILEQL